MLFPTSLNQAFPDLSLPGLIVVSFTFQINPFSCGEFTKMHTPATRHCARNSANHSDSTGDQIPFCSSCLGNQYAAPEMNLCAETGNKKKKQSIIFQYLGNFKLAY